MIKKILIILLTLFITAGCKITDSSGNKVIKSKSFYEPKFVYDKDTITQNAVKWFLNQHESLKKRYFIGKLGKFNNPSGWNIGAYLRAYIDMYEASGDIRILRKLNELLKIVADSNDIFTKNIDERTGTVMQGWGTTAYSYGTDGKRRYSDMLTNALFSYPLAAFARIVKEDSKLQKEFGDDANRYYKMVQELYKQHKPFVIDEKSPYKDGSYGMYYAFPKNYYDKDTDYSNKEAPINWSAIIAEPLIEMYRASAADQKPSRYYKTVVNRVANYIWHNIKIKKSRYGDKYLIWNYWPAVIDKKRLRAEDLTHGARVAMFVRTLYDAGFRDLWNEQKLQYLANTFTCSFTLEGFKFTNYIDGSKSSGIYKDDAATLYEWLELQDFSYSSSQHTIAFIIKTAMENEGYDATYNLAVFAKFFRYATGFFSDF